MSLLASVKEFKVPCDYLDNKLLGVFNNSARASKTYGVLLRMLYTFKLVVLVGTWDLWRARATQVDKAKFSEKFIADKIYF